ncbi:MAG: hypothetical protein HKM05_04595 [Spirochaetales bacterium]|nr:hypothetical protein [Spirochaetales bacterium]
MLNSKADWKSKVPQVTAFFWIIKVLSTTVGETAADYLNQSLGLGLQGATLVMGVLFVVALFFQLTAKRYVPWRYWLTVALISIVGTLITDNLSDRLHVPLALSTTVFSIILVIVFVIWYLNERTLSIHSIFTPRRELFYWLAILFTFSLGTAGGDFMGEALKLGYPIALSIFAAAILVIALLYRGKVLGPVLSFWLVYILTRPLGASLGDLMTQHEGGFGWGKGIVNLVFFVVIIGLVVYLGVSKVDQEKVDHESHA